MLFTRDLAEVPHTAHRAAPAHISCRPAPTDWVFGHRLTERQLDDARNTTASANGRAQARRFSGASLTGFGALA